MKQHSEIEKRVEDALNSLDGIQRAEPQPWLFSRVKGRLSKEEEKSGWETISSFLSKPTVAIAGLFLILGLNGVLVYNQQSGRSVNAIQTELQPSDSESLIASSSSFDYENLVQP